MKILVLSDIHSNITALDAVLDKAGSVDGVWCLGDLVGYGPDPNECVERIRSLQNLVCLMGNHDAAVLGLIDISAFNRDAQTSARWTQEIITKSNFNYLYNLGDTKVIDKFTLVHGSPRNPIWEYIMDSYAAEANFAFFDTQICLIGHSHIPVAFHLNNQGVKLNLLQDAPGFKIEGRTILNPGSVGQPRDHDPRAAYAILDTEELTWQPQRVEYDIESVQKRIHRAGLPKRHAIRLFHGW